MDILVLKGRWRSIQLSEEKEQKASVFFFNIYTYLNKINISFEKHIHTHLD
jgi:hypothetical protein